MRSWAGERRLCHCPRPVTPAGSIMASSMAMVPLAMVDESWGVNLREINEVVQYDC